MDVRVKTALVSVSDKTGVVDFAGKLSKMGVKVLPENSAKWGSR
jgi:AICAR transformylase/IMP cyclohydrolase PurH